MFRFFSCPKTLRWTITCSISLQKKIPGPKVSIRTESSSPQETTNLAKMLKVGANLSKKSVESPEGTEKKATSVAAIAEATKVAKADEADIMKGAALEVDTISPEDSTLIEAGVVSLGVKVTLLLKSD